MIYFIYIFEFALNVCILVFAKSAKHIIKRCDINYHLYDNIMCVIQMSFQWTEWDMKGKRFTKFYVRMYD